MFYLILVSLVLVLGFIIKSGMGNSENNQIASNDGDDDYKSPFKLGPLDTDSEHYPDSKHD